MIELNQLNISVRTAGIIKELGLTTMSDLMERLINGSITVGTVIRKPMIVGGLMIQSENKFTEKSLERFLNDIVESMTVEQLKDSEAYMLKVNYKLIANGLPIQLLYPNPLDCEWCKAHGYKVCDNPGFC